MERSARDWVRRHEFDIVALKREATDITQDEDALVTKPARRQTAGTPEMVEVTLVVSSVTGLRLDRLLSRELCISRTRLQSADKAGGLLVCPPAKAALRRMIGTSITITLLSRAFTEAEFLRICDAVFAR